MYKPHGKVSGSCSFQEDWIASLSFAQEDRRCGRAPSCLILEAEAESEHPAEEEGSAQQPLMPLPFLKGPLRAGPPASCDFMPFLSSGRACALPHDCRC